jgi:hypothetical protein
MRPDPVLADEIRVSAPTINGEEAGSSGASAGSGTSIQDQLKLVRAMQANQQKERAETEERELMAKELTYPDGRLLARGVIILAPANDALTKDFPSGLMKAEDMDAAYASDKATLFILAVGRDGPPVAAFKKQPIRDVQFPFVFEVTTDNLLFPYTEEAWRNSPNAADSIAVTAILSADELLATPSSSERVGFAVSNPVVIAGTKGRTSAAATINQKVEERLYTEEETAILSSIDRGLSQAAATPTVDTATPAVANKKR